MLTQMKSKHLGKQQNLLYPTALHLPCHFHISGSEFSPLHFTSNDSVTVHIWKRKEHLQSGLHSVAFFSHPQRSSQHRKRGYAAGCVVEGIEKAVL